MQRDHSFFSAQVILNSNCENKFEIETVTSHVNTDIFSEDNLFQHTKVNKRRNIMLDDWNVASTDYNRQVFVFLAQYLFFEDLFFSFASLFSLGLDKLGLHSLSSMLFILSAENVS